MSKELLKQDSKNLGISTCHSKWQKYLELSNYKKEISQGARQTMTFYSNSGRHASDAEVSEGKHVASISSY